MPRPKWNDKYLIGIEQFDNDHKHLMTLLNEIFDVFMSHKRNENRSQEILDALTTYTTRHFSDEESWMRVRNYSRTKEHVQDHQRFVQRLVELKKNFQDGTGHLTLDIISFLKVWLLTHIAISDADLGDLHREESNHARAIGL